MKRRTKTSTAKGERIRPAKIVEWTVLVLVMVSTVNCFGERDTKLAVQGGNPPDFMMTGSGELTALRVGGPRKQREGVAEDPYLYWVIEFKEDGTARSVESLSPILYGKVPTGYVQVFPSPSQSPPLLSEDEIYSVNAVTMDANGARVNFAIHKGKVVVDPVSRDGKLVLPE
jgi:hypothetical protein